MMSVTMPSFFALNEIKKEEAKEEQLAKENEDETAQSYKYKSNLGSVP